MKTCYVCKQLKPLFEEKHMFIVYSSSDETLICTPKSEKELLQDYFTDGGRDIDFYDREEMCGIVEIKTRLFVNGG